MNYYYGLTQPMPRRVYYSVGLSRPLVFRPELTYWTPAVYPVYTRPVYVTRSVTLRQDATWYALQSDLHNLRQDIAQARADLRSFPSVSDQALLDAERAVYDGEQQLRYGYGVGAVQASIDQARRFIDYAYSEHTAAENALASYRDHARAQLREAEYYAQNARLSGASIGALRQAQNAFERGDAVLYTNGDQAIRYFEESARYADAVVDDIARSSQPVTSAGTIERYASLLEWYEQLEDYTQRYQDFGTGFELERARQELELAQTALRLESDRNAEAALNRAERLLNDIAARLERGASGI